MTGAVCVASTSGLPVSRCWCPQCRDDRRAAAAPKGVHVMSFRLDFSDEESIGREIGRAFAAVDWDRVEREVAALPASKAPKDGTGTRKRRQTGAMVSVHFDDFLGTWVTECETHGEYCEHETKSAAVSFGSSPADWCRECWAILDARRGGGAIGG